MKVNLDFFGLKPPKTMPLPPKGGGAGGGGFAKQQAQQAKRKGQMKAVRNMTGRAQGY